MLVIGYTALCAGAGRGDHLSQRHRQRREPRRPDPGGGADRLGGSRRPRPSRRGRWGESRRGVHRPDGGRGSPRPTRSPLASVTPDSVASTQRAWQVGHADPFPLRGGIYLRCLLSGEEVLPAYQGGESLDSILDQVEADLARDPVEPTWETDDTTLHLTAGHPGQPAGPGGPPGTDFGCLRPQRHGGTDGGGPAPVYRHPPADPPWGSWTWLTSCPRWRPRCRMPPLTRLLRSSKPTTPASPSMLPPPRRPMTAWTGGLPRTSPGHHPAHHHRG